jgi:hypothetical protein
MQIDALERHLENLIFVFSCVDALIRKAYDLTLWLVIRQYGP